MTLHLEVSVEELKRGPYIKLKFFGNLKDCYGNNRFTSTEKLIEGIDISGLASTKYRFYAYRSQDDKNRVTASISFMTRLPTRKYEVTLKVVGKNYTEQWECFHMYTHWIEILTHTINSTYKFEVELELMASKSEIVTFAKLHDDTDVADFSLTTPDGSVSVHKACLAAHSDFFKTMFSGDWKETEKNDVELKDVTMTTLKHLKTYLYRGTLPYSACDLGPLYLVARCYLIEALKEKCVTKMTSTVTSANLYELVDFACEHNVPELVIMLLQHTGEEIVYGAQNNSEKKVEK